MLVGRGGGEGHGQGPGFLRGAWWTARSLEVVWEGAWARVSGGDPARLGLG